MGPTFQIIVSTPWEDLTPLITSPAWRGWTQGWENGSQYHQWPAGGRPVECPPWTRFCIALVETMERCVFVCTTEESWFKIYFSSFSYGRKIQPETERMGGNFQYAQSKVNPWSLPSWWSALCCGWQWRIIQSELCGGKAQPPTITLLFPLDWHLSVSLQRYDSHSNKWLFVTSMATRRSSVGVSVLNCLNLERSISIVKTV